MYTAAVLCQEDVTELKLIADQKLGLSENNYVFHTARGDKLPHHMTINLNKIDPLFNDIEILGKKCELEIDGIAFDHFKNVCAARVKRATVEDKEIRVANKQKHITIALRNGAKPAASNDLDWTKPIDGACGFVEIEPLVLTATIEECN